MTNSINVFEIIEAGQLVEYFKYTFSDMLCTYSKQCGCKHVPTKPIDSWKYTLSLRGKAFARAL